MAKKSKIAKNERTWSHVSHSIRVGHDAPAHGSLAPKAESDLSLFGYGNTEGGPGSPPPANNSPSGFVLP